MKQWVVRPKDARCDQLARKLSISPLLAQVLINRGITDCQAASAFLRPKLTSLIAPEQMPSVEAAVARIKRAVKSREKITVYGDYDVDGITGVAILVAILKLFGAEVDYYIPHRLDEGYGLNVEAVRSLAKAGSSLLITVDCGIASFEPAELAKQLGLDLIITDHHQPESQLPIAVAIVHPALAPSYANQDSSGSMVAFKLAWAIAKHLRRSGYGAHAKADEFSAGAKLAPEMREFMLNATSLAAMGTIADVVDLRGENRVLASYGLKALPESGLFGIQALIESAGLSGQQLDSFDIGFRLAPMLNAAGRMGHARLAVELLTSTSQTHSMQIADYLKQQNSQRQQYERKIFTQACEMIGRQNLHLSSRRSIVIANEDWHRGVIGIVASRIAEKYCRPVIMIKIAGGASAGSARSIAGFDVLSAIRACSQHLISFGGHKMAAGVTIEAEKIDKFASDFEDYAKQNLSKEDCCAKLYIDAVTPLGDFRREVVSELRMLGPFGQGNTEPIFATKGVRLASVPRRVGVKADHLQLAITDNTASVRCVGFGMAELEKKLLESEFFNVAYQPQINAYNGTESVELILRDIQFE
jgi:single-stranded-DNA-specific exonuclease